MEPDGGMYHLDSDGTLIPYVQETEGDFHSSGSGQELSSMRSFLSNAQDYVARARYLVGTQNRDTDDNGDPISGVEARRAIAKLERATMELRQGLLSQRDHLLKFSSIHYLLLQAMKMLNEKYKLRYY